ncbi:Carbonic anhydrase 2 [Moraxella equi]|uniref:Carbonic anhydrase 2 n=1 Tax=Moraxella equi TaxID=60442 RepID=A0A378QRS3_9GAMM|nr:Carbonic anhydrase 2 [Moraxella equi]
MDKFDNLNIDEQTDLLCELNVKRQVTNVCHTTIVQNAWHRGQKLSVHGWIYGLKDGLIHDLQVSVNDFSQLKDAFVYEV